MNEQLLKQCIEEAGEKPFRFKQCREAVFTQLVSGWDEITSLSADFRQTLNEKVPFSSVEHLTTVESEAGDTIKSAFKLADGNIVEAVIMRHKGGRNTACISSQAGCALKCNFCATGTMGLKRNLTTEEMVDQTLHLARVMKANNTRLSNLVWMGMGEPMQNYDSVMEASRIMNAKDGLCIGARNMSISTCGIVPGIMRLADENFQMNLAVSLHAPNDKMRTLLMPVNRAYSLAKLMPAIENYVDKTNRKVFFEYLLIEDFNDSLATADELADLLDHKLYHVNLIKYHSTGVYTSSSRNRRMQFMQRLENRGISVTHRITFGEDIDAACGQLANKEAKAKA